MRVVLPLLRRPVSASASGWVQAAQRDCAAAQRRLRGGMRSVCERCAMLRGCAAPLAQRRTAAHAATARHAEQRGAPLAQRGAPCRLLSARTVPRHAATRRQRGGAACALAPPADAPPVAAVQFETDAAGLSRLVYRESGWRYYTWRSHRCHYVVHGSGPPVVLVHGFGANAYHWRYNLAELSKTHTVYCVCLLGFGWSDKALVDYSLELWGSQISDFIRDVVGAPAVIAGNSIGAVTVLSAAFTDPALVRGVVLLNAAGRFDADVAVATPPTRELFLSEILKRVASFVIFVSTKLRISQILRTVYVDHSKVDADLVESIYRPACEPDALEAFFLISGSGGRSKRTLNELLRGCQPLPMLLLWGNQDPWMKNDKARKIVELYAGATLVNIAAGSHCPHDDAPVEVNAALLHWMAALPA